MSSQTQQLTQPHAGEVIFLPDGPIPKPPTALKPLGALGVHDRFHLSASEKRQLVGEVRDFLNSRVSGPPCPSCLSDVLILAAVAGVREAVEDPLLNSGTAEDFVVRTRDWGSLFSQMTHPIERARNAAVRYERTHGEFRDGRPIREYREED